MGIYLLKFIHLLCTLSLLGLIIYIVLFAPNRMKQLSRLMLYLSLLALMTGTLLIYPKHFSFHTPWIQAAYLLIVVFATGIIFLRRIEKKFLQRTGLIALSVILLLIVHDAVTKTTFLF